MQPIAGSPGKDYSLIEITLDNLSAHHGPLPYPGDRSVPYRELREIRVEKVRKAGVFFFFAFEGGGFDLTPKASFCQLSATLEDGTELDLLYGSDERTIRYLEAAITAHLRMKGLNPTTSWRSQN